MPVKLSAYLYALSAFVMWGLLPLYFKDLSQLSAQEILFHRVIWSAILGTLLLLVWRYPKWWQVLFKQPKYIVILFFTGALLAGNWLLYVWAINHHYMLEASLGYYINPLISVLLGMLFLKERLRRLQWLALLFAIVGVVIQVILFGRLPWIALLLAFSFGFYGLIRKLIPLAPLPGMFMETWLMVPLACIWLYVTPTAMTLEAGFWQSSLLLKCLLAGPFTLLPLIFFNLATKALPYSTVGFFQYVSPTLVFLLAIFYYQETYHYSTLLTFSCIWLALLIFSVESYYFSRNRHRWIAEKVLSNDR